MSALKWIFLDVKVNILEKLYSLKLPIVIHQAACVHQWAFPNSMMLQISVLSEVKVSVKPQAIPFQRGLLMFQFGKLKLVCNLLTNFDQMFLQWINSPCNSWTIDDVWVLHFVLRNMIDDVFKFKRNNSSVVRFLTLT